MEKKKKVGTNYESESANFDEPRDEVAAEVEGDERFQAANTRAADEDGWRRSDIIVGEVVGAIVRRGGRG